MNNVVGSDDCRVLSELSPEERERIAKMIADRFDDIAEKWNDGYRGYAGDQRVMRRPFRDDTQPRKSAWSSVKRGIARLRASVGFYIKARTALREER